jgi:replication fork clamp-binding protein CrfC
MVLVVTYFEDCFQWILTLMVWI